MVAAQLEDGEFVSFSSSGLRDSLTNQGEVILDLDLEQQMIFLDISYSHMGNRLTELFLWAAMSNCRNLQCLNLESSQLTSVGSAHPIVALLTQEEYNLSTLIIADNPFDRRSMALLGGALGRNKSLESLTVSVNQQHLDHALSRLTQNYTLDEV
ncbi:hypothetical protein THAOC_13480 [Thalassiosira oceanica]|uniref:Uncharacterized protein n=1 Tax=Thalassiosira oceanica TaxID=159749 RepID=K0SL11_THAOC|nr:hypothetical protein THAOC_13480 [Thalassiosira oceanica]|eukprot:EJK65639.1 hypothetical protein THAOC_13480 [Thalassiosira oceanica]